MLDASEFKFHYVLFIEYVQQQQQQQQRYWWWLFIGIVCKGLCGRHRATKPREGGRYASGQKRCNHCDVFMHWDGIFCPCCNHRLRLGPRNTKNKKVFLKVLHQRKNLTRKD